MIFIRGGLLKDEMPEKCAKQISPVEYVTDDASWTEVSTFC